MARFVAKNRLQTADWTVRIFWTPKEGVSMKFIMSDLDEVVSQDEVNSCSDVKTLMRWWHAFDDVGSRVRDQINAENLITDETTEWKEAAARALAANMSGARSCKKRLMHFGVTPESLNESEANAKRGKQLDDLNRRIADAKGSAWFSKRLVQAISEIAPDAKSAIMERASELAANDFPDEVTRR